MKSGCQLARKQSRRGGIAAGLGGVVGDDSGCDDQWG